MKEINSSLPEVMHRLQERVKELNCLYAITRLVEQSDLTVDDILQSVTDLIPPSWQYPDITGARIKLSDKEFQTSNFIQTAWKQSDIIIVNGQESGIIEVCYLEEMPESDEGPFLTEERNLIHVIAERLGHIIEHRLAQDSLQSLYEQEKQLRERIQDEMQRRINFTRNLIHELKTPLTALLATSQLLLEEEQNEPLGKLAQYVWEGANSLNTKIDELHDLVRGEIGTLKLELKPFDVSEMLPSIISETQALARQYGVTLNLKLSSDLPRITADGARVRQIVLNLLNNAFKYASEGSKVTIICSADDRFLKLEVKDRGPGIPLEEQKYLFEPGYQADHRSELAGGLGIGLALCKLLTELHGGKIWVKSKIGKGTSFYFTLPLQGE
ncbi:MAG: HAMP domain-containing sensor histidine kinase [Dehalococcoidales bacterium]